MSAYTFAQSQQAARALSLLNPQTRSSAAADQLHAVAYGYANNGGLKPAIEAARLGQYAQGKKQATAPKAGTLGACVIGALDYIMQAAPAQGARPEAGADIPARTALGTAFADTVAALFCAGLAAAQGMTKASAEATKAAKAAEAEAAQGTQGAEGAAEAALTEGEKALSLSALLARVEAALALSGDDVARDALEQVPSLKAIALQWAEAARVKGAEAAGAAVEAAKAEAEAARALCAEAEAEAAALRQGLAEAATRAQQAEAAEAKAPKAAKATKATKAKAAPLPMAA